MSEATYQKVIEAIEHHIADEEPDTIAGSLITLVELIPLREAPEEGTRYTITRGNHFSIMGLLHDTISAVGYTDTE